MRLHRFLAGRRNAAPTYAWWVGRICEEFGVDPIRAAVIWRRDPDLVQRVLQERSYASWFQRLQDAKDDTDWPAEGTVPTADRVVAMHAEYLQAQRARRAAAEETSCE
jgi:hypothetical protein